MARTQISTAPVITETQVLKEVIQDAIEGKILLENPSVEQLREFFNILRLPITEAIDRGLEFTRKLEAR
jgi:hypothetical protein